MISNDLATNRTTIRLLEAHMLFNLQFLNLGPSIRQNTSIWFSNTRWPDVRRTACVIVIVVRVQRIPGVIVRHRRGRSPGPNSCECGTIEVSSHILAGVHVSDPRNVHELMEHDALPAVDVVECEGVGIERRVAQQGVDVGEVPIVEENRAEEDSSRGLEAVLCLHVAAASTLRGKSLSLYSGYSTSSTDC